MHVQGLRPSQLGLRPTPAAYMHNPNPRVGGVSHSLFFEEESLGPCSQLRFNPAPLPSSSRRSSWWHGVPHMVPGAAAALMREYTLGVSTRSALSHHTPAVCSNRSLTSFLLLRLCVARTQVILALPDAQQAVDSDGARCTGACHSAGQRSMAARALHRSCTCFGVAICPQKVHPARVTQASRGLRLRSLSRAGTS